MPYVVHTTVPVSPLKHHPFPPNTPRTTGLSNGKSNGLISNPLSLFRR